MRYLTRLVDPWITEILASAPAVMITGARAAGKTTTALRHAASVVRLDNEREAAPFRADPDAALRDRPEPVLLDEWQECPEVLGALKRAVDTERRPGRFILTGSVHADVDPALWPGTGRLIRVPMHPLTVREQLSRRGRPFLDRLLAAEAPEDPGDTPDLRGYAEMALRGGFPEPAVQLPDRIRNQWLSDYVDQLTHGSPGRGRPLDRSRLRAFFSVYALNSAGVAADTTLYQAAGIDRRTAHAYTKLLNDLGAIAELPAWSSNRLKRLSRGPKRYIADTGLWGAAVGADAALVMSDGDLLGRLIETFVANQLRAEVAVDPNRPRLHHLRDREGRHEVDLIADLGMRGLVAIEVKAHSAPSPRHARNLAWLHDQMGDRFLTGVLLHTGPAAFKLTDRIRAIPISAIWS
ncbi:ATP-binding protein [Candidatus Spongiisocius sp.]|uniref:ATP-binding protein n=1 Tax=Candidatus Spongiisocius sp. TaxID=3101273 RepID=UPI003B5CD7AF